MFVLFVDLIECSDLVGRMAMSRLLLLVVNRGLACWRGHVNVSESVVAVYDDEQQVDGGSGKRAS